MKIPAARFTTLSPVHRVAAFFAFFCTVLLLSACKGEKEQSFSQNMAEQTVVYNEMTAVLERLIKGGDVDTAISELDTLIETHKFLKRQLTAKGEPTEEEKTALADNAEFSKATASFFSTLAKYQSSDKVSQKVQRTLQNLHDSEPVQGEGSP